MVEWLDRSDWGARPPTNSSALIRSEVDGTAIHYPGMGTRTLTTQAQVASALRGWQNYHMDDRGWADIAYQAAVDQAGRKWKLRGLTIRSAANGDSDVNHRYGAILLVIGDNEPLSAPLKATVREVVAEFRRYYPAGTQIKPHSAVRPDPTSCPGNLARAAIARGEFVPITPPAPTGQDLDVDEATLRRIIADELNKQDSELWTAYSGRAGTGKVAVIDVLTRLETKVNAIEAKLNATQQ